MRSVWLLMIASACAGGAHDEATRAAPTTSAAASSASFTPQAPASSAATHVVVPSNPSGKCDDPTWWLAYLVTLAKSGDARSLAFVARHTSTRPDEVHRAEDALARADDGARARSITDAETVIAKNRPACAPPFSLPPRSTPVRNDAGVTSGWLEPRVIQHVVRASFGRAKVCYTELLRKEPSAGGQVRTKFVIEMDGTASKVEDVTGAEDGLKDATARECVRKVFASLVFPPPADGVVTVVYPLIFSPGE